MKILSGNSHSISLTFVRKVHDLDHMVFNRMQVKQERKTLKVKEIGNKKDQILLVFYQKFILTAQLTFTLKISYIQYSFPIKMFQIRFF